MSDNPATPPSTPIDATSTTTTAPIEKKTDAVPTAAAVAGMGSLQRLAVATESAELPKEQKDVLVQLKGYQEEHLQLEEQYRMEWNELKLKYLARFKPLYAARKEILTSSSSGGGDVSEGTPSLPQFWLKAMKNHVLLAEMIEVHDVPILSHLKDIEFQWVDPKEQTSFKLDFIFSPNEYFTNTVLSKIYHLEKAEDEADESVLTRTEGTAIIWNPGKNVTSKSVTRKQRNKRTNQTRTVTEVVDDNSFFNFFRSHEIPSEEQLQHMEEREVSELEMIVEAEFEIGCILRDKIIPRAVGWYLGIERDEAESEDEVSGAGEYEEDDEDEDE